MIRRSEFNNCKQPFVYKRFYDRQWNDTYLSYLSEQVVTDLHRLVKLNERFNSTLRKFYIFRVMPMCQMWNAN